MATRIEIQLGCDLIKKTDRINRAVLSIGLMLQNKSIEGTSLGLTVADIKNRVAVITALRTDWIEKTLNHVPYVPIIATGVGVYSITTLPITQDIAKVNQGRAVIQSDLAAANTLPKLAIVGRVIEQLPINLSVVLPEIYRPPIVHMINDCHDLLDSLSYEYAGRNSQNGVEGVIDLAQMQRRSINRLLCFDTARQLCESYYSLPVEPKFALNKDLLMSDLSVLVAIKNYIQSSWQDCTSESDFVTLGNYISTNLPKLPLVRRHWAI